MNKYHIVTCSYGSGEDAKQDTATLKEAVKLAKEWLTDEYYHKVKIFNGNNLAREFIGIGKGKTLRTV